jgi:hypothetical protein
MRIDMHLTYDQLKLIRLALFSHCWVATKEEKEKIINLLAKIEKETSKQGGKNEHRTSDIVSATKGHIDIGINAQCEL